MQILSIMHEFVKCTQLNVEKYKRKCYCRFNGNVTGSDTENYRKFRNSE
jgi:hypothetical protein